MKLAFSGEGRYTDYKSGYQLYVSRLRGREAMDFASYKRVVQMYCKSLSDELLDNGMIDLPSGIGTVAAVEITRKPQYRGKKFIGYGKMDWQKGHYDGSLKAFGIGFLPRRDKVQNLRSFGFVANRRLFKRMKERYNEDYCPWSLVPFNDSMV